MVKTLKFDYSHYRNAWSPAVKQFFPWTVLSFPFSYSLQCGAAGCLLQMDLITIRVRNPGSKHYDTRVKHVFNDKVKVTRNIRIILRKAGIFFKTNPTLDFELNSEFFPSETALGSGVWTILYRCFLFPRVLLPLRRQRRVYLATGRGHAGSLPVSSGLPTERTPPPELCCPHTCPSVLDTRASALPPALDIPLSPCEQTRHSGILLAVCWHWSISMALNHWEKLRYFLGPLKAQYKVDIIGAQ